MFPQLESRTLSVTSDYVNKYIGVNLSAERMAAILTKMQLSSTVADDGVLSSHPCLRGTLVAFEAATWCYYCYCYTDTGLAA